MRSRARLRLTLGVGGDPEYRNIGFTGTEACATKRVFSRQSLMPLSSGTIRCENDSITLSFLRKQESTLPLDSRLRGNDNKGGIFVAIVSGRIQGGEE